ncbi:MAG: NADH-quinone oxidoreductase subunit J [Acidimicrobiales bacterium]|jgi:NADH-quinone oxidoreductase subunit J
MTAGVGLLAAEMTRTEVWVTNSFFVVIAVVAIFAALKMVTTDNVVHSALYLLIVLASVAAVYIILGAEFAAATQILVYIGAILVLLLFGVMLTRAQIGSETDLDHDQKWIGALVAVIMAAVMGYALWEGFEDAKLPDNAVVQRTDAVADSIFGTYIVPFEALSVLLLAALIGAVVVARRD